MNINRELKFRAWDESRKGMLYKELFDHWWYATPTNDESGCHAVREFKPNDIRTMKIMQFTGLKDSKGKDIYEGDLIKNEKYPYPHKIIYTFSHFVGQQVKGKFEGYADGLFFNRFDVIGNIYENPELLK